MRVLDLFSGIGGFSLGLGRAGMQTAAFCEIDAYCRAILNKHWPDIPIFEDIKKLDGREFRGRIDLVCGGYPCQPFSAIGKRRGAQDERHLWPEMFRIIREAKPAWVIGENVRGHITLGFDSVVTDLESEGFTVWPFIIPAYAVGAPHIRERVWIIARSKTVAYSAHSERDGGQASGIQGDSGWEQTGGCNSAGIPAGGWWLSQPPMVRVSHGIPDRVDRVRRVRALGNAIVPQIAECIGMAIIRYESAQAGIVSRG